MKLSITKKNIKNLSQDNKRLPAAMTKAIHGGATSYFELKKTTTSPVSGDSSDTSVTSPSDI
ncbi:hypothetical protein A7985_21070 [Pseudoalteromonas luteoviolacea]|uniref:Uncharacterized protein n=1 Tax=Pseudoalteromonas luteoviolacea TaxID=43657 RepID=A0A1C0TLJ8_9GAMM|nr:hypothetical protein [Pseudoalteromonas luteoviolacea]MBQ4812671.1 hypothetical protein [Pseudoalteromonas luteoviolacea]OCQ19227.1 hypothetical protein A7985_21070 [Pseudoalteromonas luteoviolacea]